jgi:leucine dehydrogenase
MRGRLEILLAFGPLPVLKAARRRFIVIDSTALGPAFGGCRIWRYGCECEALVDARWLACGMTGKNASAALLPGGDKSVLMKPLHEVDRRAFR